MDTSVTVGWKGQYVMFALEKELVAIIRKDPVATHAEKKRAELAIRCKAERTVTFADAAERLSVSKASVYKLVRNGELVGKRLTGVRPYGVTEESLAAFEERRQVMAKRVQRPNMRSSKQRNERNVSR